MSVSSQKTGNRLASTSVVGNDMKQKSLFNWADKCKGLAHSMETVCRG